MLLIKTNFTYLPNTQLGGYGQDRGYGQDILNLGVSEILIKGYLNQSFMFMDTLTGNDLEHIIIEIRNDLS